jgi:hypothetical protein
MSDYLIEEAIKVARENKETFGFTLLKRKLHIGLVTCNMILNEMEKLGTIERTDNPKKQYNVLI